MNAKRKGAWNAGGGGRGMKQRPINMVRGVHNKFAPPLNKRDFKDNVESLFIKKGDLNLLALLTNTLSKYIS